MFTPQVLVGDTEDLPETMTVYVKKHDGNYLAVYLDKVSPKGFHLIDSLRPGVPHGRVVY